MRAKIQPDDEKAMLKAWLLRPKNRNIKDLKNNAMETDDLENKKINNEQKVNEGFSGENLPEDYDPAAKKLKPETETDQYGNTKTVDRARHTEQPPAPNDTGLDDNPTRKAVENKDRNSDIATNRYPNSHPDNHTNRGNIEMDES